MDGLSASELGISVAQSEAKQRPAKGKVEMKSTESINNSQRFSEETRKSLLEKGYKIFALKGDTLSEEEMNRFVNPFLINNDASLIAQDHTQNSEVALAPFRILEESKDGTFDEQNDLVKKYSLQVEEQFPGATVIMGEIADYVALEAQYQKENPGKTLFKDGFVRSRTFIQRLGKDEKNFFLAEGDVVSYCDPRFKFEGMYVVPLIVPVAA